MALYTKIDQQLDNYCEIVTKNKRLSNQNYYLKLNILSILICYVFMIIKCFI